jgi:hypothetical protein
MRISALTGTCVSLLAALIGPAAVATQDAIRHRDSYRQISTVIDQDVFDAIARHLQLSKDQRTLAWALLIEYHDALASVEREIADQMELAGINAFEQEMREALQRGEQVDEAVREEYSYRMRMIWFEAEPVWTGAMQSFLDDLQTLLDNEQRERFERVPRIIRRIKHLQRDGAYVDMGRPIDVVELAEQAGVPGGELASLFDAATGLPHEPLAQILDVYERRVDDVIRAREVERAGRPQRDQVTRIDGGTPEHEKYLEEQAERWRTSYSILRSAIDAIAVLAQETAGDAARDAWMDRFYRHWAASLYRPLWPEQVSAWLDGRDDLSDTQREQILRLHEEHLRQRDLLRMVAIEKGIESWRRTGSPYSQSDEAREFFEAMQAMVNLGAEFHEKMRGLLHEAQRADFDAARQLALQEFPPAYGQ